MTTPGPEWLFGRSSRASRVVVVEEASDGRAALSAARRLDADVLVLDLKMEGSDGIEVLRAIKAEKPDLKVLMLTMHAGREYVTRAVHEGADGYLLKDSAVQDLVAAIQAVMAATPITARPFSSRFPRYCGRVAIPPGYPGPHRSRARGAGPSGSWALF
jgi:DNA-binding NarL/FixJ family response regulator